MLYTDTYETATKKEARNFNETKMRYMRGKKRKKENDIIIIYNIIVL